MDETGLSTVPNRLPKVMAPKGKRCVSKVVAAERGQSITAVCCMSPSGIWVPPALIFPRKRMKEELFTGAPMGTLKLISDTGYMNTDLFLQWLKHFVQFVKPTCEEPVVLILDNHVSHCSLEAIIYCRDNSTVMLTLPPHSSHKVQPLDVGFFAPLKRSFSNECDKWMVTHPGMVITQKQLAALFNAAYSRSANISICQKSFEATGLYPYNPDVFTDDDFAPAEVTDIPIGGNENREESGRVEEIDEEDKENRCDITTAISSDEDDLPLSYIVTKGLQTTSNAETTNNRTPEKEINTRDIVSLPGPSRVINEKTPEKKIRILQNISIIPPQSKQLLVTPLDIVPLPKVKHAQKRSRASRKSEILTSTPYKNEVEEKEAAKGKLPKKNVFNSRKGSTKQTLKKAKKDDDAICPGCEERYSASKSRSAWIQCIQCALWWHEDCTSYEGLGTFTCDLC